MRDGSVSGCGVCAPKRRVTEAKEVAERRLNKPTVGYEQHRAILVLLGYGMESGADANRELRLCFRLGLEPMKSPVTLLERAPLSHELFGLDVSVIAAPLFEVAAWCDCQTKDWG